MSEGQYPRGLCRHWDQGPRPPLWQGLDSSSHISPHCKPPSCPEVYSAASSEALTLEAVGVGQQLCFFLPEQLSQFLPLPTPKLQLFQTFCLKCKSSLFQMGSLRLEQTSALPQTWACFCLPRMPESAWRGCVACSLALCPGSLEKPALFLDITHSRVWPALSLLCQMLRPGPTAAKSPPSSLFQACVLPSPSPDTDGLRMRLS